MAPQPLSVHRHEVQIGRPLPFGICDSEGRLLLASGQRIESEIQLEGLLERGAFVQRDAAADALSRIESARAEQLPGLWTDSLKQVGRALGQAGDARFAETLETAAKPLLALVERDADLAIIQILRDDAADGSDFATRRVVHAAIAGQLASRRLGWGDSEAQLLQRAALSMNIGMLELQNRLNQQRTPATATQRALIDGHARVSAEILERAGVADRDWIEAVAHHHDGVDLPAGRAGDIALMLRRTDRFTAMHSARPNRAAMPADVAARRFFQESGGDPAAAAIIKEFGIYPPGCAVRLKSGEIGIVVRRGEAAHAPIVAAVVDRHGDPLLTPVRRATAGAAHAVVGVVPVSTLKVRVPLSTLIAACPA